ncbi:MAG: hypothetical protein D6731_19665 [Planctomycetota bacterium]|nr:MAG: hypothetical protein D6731_19665 [Planctomycetota bacterium]
MRGLRPLACLLFVVLVVAEAPVAARAQEPRPLRLRVVSHNVWGLPWGISRQREERLAALGPALAALKPDVVALQEVWVPADGERLARDLAAAGLVHHRHVSEGLLGSGLLVASRYPLQGARFVEFYLAGKPHRVGHGDFYARKGALLLRLDTPAGPLLLADTHWHARYGTCEYEALQVTQALQVIDLLGDHGARPPARPDDPARPPLVLCGDLNSERGDLPFRLLCAGAALRAPRAPLRIDWLLARDGGRVRVDVLGVRPHALSDPHPLPGGGRARLSDHDAVVVDLRLAPGRPRAEPPEQARERWEAVSAEAIRLLERERAAVRDLQERALGRAVVLGLASLLLFLGARAWSRRKEKPGRLGCALGGASLLALHLLAWAIYFGALFAPYYAAGLARGLARLGAG